MGAVPVATVVREAAFREAGVSDAALPGPVTAGGCTTCPQFDWKSVARTMMARRAYRRRVRLSVFMEVWLALRITGNQILQIEFAAYRNVCASAFCYSARRRDDAESS
jgi:hypothetical protein